MTSKRNTYREIWRQLNVDADNDVGTALDGIPVIQLIHYEIQATSVPISQ